MASGDPVVVAQVSALCAEILRKRIENFDQLPEEQQGTWVKDEAGHIAQIAAALADHPNIGRWLDGAPDGFGRWLVQALMLLSLDMRETAQW